MLPLTDTTVTPDDLQDCHAVKNKEKVIIKYKDRKHKNKVIFDWKELKSKIVQLQDWHIGPSFFINDSMCLENQSLFYKGWQSKNAGEVFSFCRSSHPEVFCEKGVVRNFTKFNARQLCQSLFFHENSTITRIFHITDLRKYYQLIVLKN